jgi:hypothetical protein
MNRVLHLLWKSVVFILFLISIVVYPLYAQEASPAGEAVPPHAVVPETAEPSPEEPPPQTLEEKVMEMDIKTSTLSELAAWCRSLGLSEGGTREELTNRLRTYYKLPPPGQETAEEPKKQKIITIESARSTEYFTLDVVDEEYARLQGDVVISLKDGEAIHQIKAGEILYNRTRNLMTASGKVEYVKTDGDTIETFKGESITVNLDNWSSIFLGGMTERSLNKEDAAYRFEGRVISRSNEEVTVMTDAVISNAKNEESYWSLNAHKLWLLPGSDWAVLSAVLKVGEIPLLYIPFFYFPADEIVFHPVIGHRSRVGNFLQTTTYIMGRPKAEPGSESSISKILGSGEDMEKVREGIFLRSTGKKSRDPNDTRLSLLLDVYSNLGAYFGTDLTFPKKNILGAIALSAGIGVSRDIYPLSSGYSPFAQYEGTDKWNSSRLFSTEVPFRYRFNTTGSLAGSYGSLSWTFPFYADPYMNQDFLDRSEEMDWVQMLKGETEETEDTSKNLISSHEWRLNGSLSFPPLVAALTPYISSFAISSISSSLAFNTRESTDITNGVSPNRRFFFPNKLTFYSASISMAGTLLTLGKIQSDQTPKAEESQEDPFQGIGTPRAPWETPEEDPEKAQESAAGIDQLTPPVLSQQFDLPNRGGPLFTIEYQFSPSSASELQFRSSQQNWPNSEDIDWSEISSILTNVRGTGSVGFKLNQQNIELYTISFRLSGNGQWQDYTYINEEAEEYTTGGVTDQSRIDSARLRTYQDTFFTTSYETITTLRPLYGNAIWERSNIQYTLRGLLAKSLFKGTGDDPSWDVDYGEWTKEKIDAHQMAMNLDASIMDKSQTLTLTMDLPPKDATLSGNSTIRAWITTTNINTKILNPWESEDRKFEPVNFSETIGFGTTYPFQFQQQATYSPELEEWTNLSSSISWVGLTASFTAIRSRTYILENTGWIQSTDPESLNPREFRIAYAKNFKKDSLWDKRLSFSCNINTNLTFDLQQYTKSQLNLTLSFSLGITNFLDITLSTTSQNAVVFRYFQNLPFFDLPRELPGEQSFFVDLFNSFRFDNESLRKSSGFKWKSFSLSMVHHLGDWNATLKISLAPSLDQTVSPYQYKFSPEVSFLVQWIPISEIKTDIYHNKDGKTVLR